jgi:GLPGLI family protein
MKVMKDNDLEGGVGDPQEVYKNYPTGKISVTNPIAGTVYYYEDALNGIQWQIETDTATILSYICQKAVADFRGRHFTAWFAPDLPINDGPWKFMGLPGLILAVEDADKYFCFRAMSLENSTRPILVSKGSFMKATREEVAKVQKRFAQNPVEFLSNSLGSGNVRVVAQDENGIEKSTSELKFPYNPIELE